MAFDEFGLRSRPGPRRHAGETHWAFGWPDPTQEKTDLLIVSIANARIFAFNTSMPTALHTLI